MSSVVTNRGKKNLLNRSYRGITRPTNYYVGLFDSSIAADPDINVKSDLAEVPAGNGYTSGGIQLTPNSTDFDVLTEDDTNDRSLIQIKNLVWTAAGGNLPGSGTGARYAALTDDNATPGNREVDAIWDLAGNRVVSDTQQLTLVDCEIRLT